MKGKIIPLLVGGSAGAGILFLVSKVEDLPTEAAGQLSTAIIALAFVLAVALTILTTKKD